MQPHFFSHFFYRPLLSGTGQISADYGHRVFSVLVVFKSRMLYSQLPELAVAKKSVKSVKREEHEKKQHSAPLTVRACQPQL
jgi:hypothetical protein